MLQGSFKTLADIASAVKTSRGTESVRMSTLRDAAGYGKLGVNVVEEISAALDELGLRHHPQTLPRDQYKAVRLFVKGGDAERALAAFISLEGDDHAIQMNDDFLNGVIDKESRSKLEQIRAITTS